jgi:purine-nucleoside phosphorylase
VAGVRDLILLEPGVSLREDLKPGTWMAATDYINAMGVSPVETCLELVDDPFKDMTDAFSQALNSEIINAAAGVGVNPRLGIYQGTPGPHFDTPAEAETARRNGADMLGNGIIPETVAGVLMGCRVTALVLAAEAASSYYGRRLRHADVVDAAQFCSADIMRAFRGMVLDQESTAETSRDPIGVL